MAIKANSSTIVNSYTPPFRVRGDFQKNQILIWDPKCRAFVNADASVLSKILGLPNMDPTYETIYLYSDLGNGAQTTYVIPWAAQSIDNLIVTINGVKQLSGTFTIQVFGDITNVTFLNPVPDQASVEILGFQFSSLRRIQRSFYVGDGIENTFPLPWSVNSNKSVLVFIDGIKQHQGVYALEFFINNSSQLNFLAPVAAGSELEVIAISGFDPNSFKFANFLGDDVETEFVVPWIFDSYESVFVTIDGVKQHVGTFSFSSVGASTVIAFQDPVALGSEVEVLGFTGLISQGCKTCTVVGQNLGTGFGIFNSATPNAYGQTVLSFRSIEPGPGILMNSTADKITISADATNFSLSTVGAGESLLAGPTEIKSLLGQGALEVQDLGDEIQFSIDDSLLTLDGLGASDFGQNIVSVGTVGLVKKTSASPDGVFELYGLRAGLGITITRVNDDIVIADANGGNYVKIISNYVVERDDAIVGVDTSQGAFTVTLPNTALAGPGKTVTIKDESGQASLNNITVTGFGGQTIDGQPSVSISFDRDYLKVYTDGTNWFII